MRACLETKKVEIPVEDCTPDVFYAVKIRDKIGIILKQECGPRYETRCVSKGFTAGNGWSTFSDVCVQRLIAQLLQAGHLVDVFGTASELFTFLTAALDE